MPTWHLSDETTTEILPCFSPTSATSTTVVWHLWVRTATTMSNAVEWVALPPTWQTPSQTSSWTSWQSIHYHQGVCSRGGVAEESGLFAEQIELERAAAVERMKLLNEELELERARRETAEMVAERLLLGYLNERQRQEYSQRGAFNLISQDGRRYRVEKKRAGNVVLMEDAEDGSLVPTRRFCLHSVKHVPLADDLLVALIMLTRDEKEYLKIANSSQLTHPPLRQNGEAVSCVIAG